MKHGLFLQEESRVDNTYKRRGSHYSRDRSTKSLRSVFVVRSYYTTNFTVLIRIALLHVRI